MSMHKEWIAAGLDESEAWLRVYDEAREWYLPSLGGLLGVVLVTAILNKFNLLGSGGTFLLAAVGVGGALAAMRLVKWHQEMQA